MNIYVSATSKYITFPWVVADSASCYINLLSPTSKLGSKQPHNIQLKEYALIRLLKAKHLYVLWVPSIKNSKIVIREHHYHQGAIERLKNNTKNNIVTDG